MITRQAIKQVAMLLMLFGGCFACSSRSQPTPAIIVPSSTVAPTFPSATFTPSPFPTATLTPLTCLTNPGRVEEGTLDATSPAQEFRVYLPPCYDERADQHYPVLYLLHGQTYTDDQWIRLGAAEAADQLIISGESIPFMIVFPDDRYWNLPPGPGFGQRLVDVLVPHIDSTYRTLPDRPYRAIGGLSRGAGWALRLGLTHWNLFSAIGLHSIAASPKDASNIPAWMADIPVASRPRVFMDIGDNDPELAMASRVESQFNEYGLTHEWHLYSGAHTEEYWSAHVEEYLHWYIEGWDDP